MLKKTSLSHTYWIAFTILAIWAAFAYYTLHSLIASQQTYGKLINLSGMQRMLSQKTALYGHLLHHHALPPGQLVTPVQTMKTNHRFITEHLDSEDLRRRYFGQDGLDAQVRHYFVLLDTFMTHPTPPQGEAITRYAMTLLPHSDDLEQRIQSRLIVVNLLRDAITGDELTLHLQPEVDLRTGRITGAEALIRWYREGQLISPQQFIPITEESHLIKQIDLWVVTETLRLLETIHAAGFTDFSIALNLSGCRPTPPLASRPERHRSGG